MECRVSSLLKPYRQFPKIRGQNIDPKLVGNFNCLLRDPQIIVLSGFRCGEVVGPRRSPRHQALGRPEAAGRHRPGVAPAATAPSADMSQGPNSL